MITKNSIEIIFDEMDTKEFNSFFNTQLNQEMTFDEAVSEIERKENEYYYTSMAKQDIYEAISNKDLSLIEQLNLWNIFIPDLGIYISMKP